MNVILNILSTKFVSTTLSTQPQTLFAFLQSEAGSNNKRDKIKSCKYQNHEGIFVSETDKYIVPSSLMTKVYNLVH